MATRHKGYYTHGVRPTGRTERRIQLPQPVKRPVRFQIRSIIKHDIVRPRDPWWFIVHSRGIPRPRVGEDPLEQRAVPHSMMRGTVLERIVYRYLVEKLHFVPGIDFTSQTSLQGGRVELGGIVADFVFPALRIVLNPLGPTHDEYLRIRKDMEQVQALEEMGYTVYMIDQETIKDEYKFEDYMRRVFGWLHAGGPNVGYDVDGLQTHDGLQIEAIYNKILELQAIVRAGA